MREPVVHWLLEQDASMPSTARVAASGARCVPVSAHALRHGAWPEIKAPAVVYASMDTAALLRSHPTLQRFLFDDPAALRCTSYYRYVYDLFRRRTFFVPWRALTTLDLNAMLGPRVFVRPDTNDKAFPARVVSSSALPELVDTFAHHHDKIVVVSEVLDIQAEFRCFCREGEVFTHSSYPREPFEPAPSSVLEFARVAAKRMMTELNVRMLTVDVAVCTDGLRLVELGGVNSWGLYGADVNAFVREMEDEARLTQDL